MEIELREVARMLGLSIGTEKIVTGWSIDSRTIEPGDLFFALRGPNHDGHEHVNAALEKGAVAVVVDRDVEARGPVLRVEDSLDALQQVAKAARRTWAGSVVGVTGSAGKTTTKDVIAEMLATEMKTAKTVGNLNNHVGVPLSLLRLDENARIAVIEMGMNHAGEIRHLAEIAKPDVGVVTNVGYAHMEAFESIEEIAAAKRELIDALPESGTAVLNADDPRVAAMAGGKKKVVLYGLAAEAHIRAEDVEESAEGLKFRVGKTHFSTALYGRHSV
ncbi:MAG TPA: UDP-N-acetylmuramoyl-tripeptide--D-alanyl-D-alanine ligase, partial [Bryobacteraceae bacterium]|nr:UDP-N-acetylmuramoyl-tripeptide--D-alanyl-D-alanine ligase [Bryobacteraceae bacterium]